MANDVNNAAALSTAASASSASASLEGLHELQIDLEEITREYYEKAEKFYEYIEKAFDSMIGKDDAERAGKKDTNEGNPLLGGKKKEKEGPAIKVTKSLKVDKLIDFQDSVAGLGVVLHNDFQQLFKKMDKQPKEGKKGKGIGDLFEGLGKGAKGLLILAGALVAFAVAAAVFNFVDWPKAMVGLVMFTGFVIGSIFLAKAVKKSTKDFQEFAKGLLWMTLAYAVFGVALVVVSNITKYVNIMGLITSLVSFAAFVAGTVVLAKFLKKGEKDFQDFAKSVLLMIGAYVAFGVAIVLVSNLAKFIDWPGLLISLGLFAGFVVGTFFLAKFLKNGQGDLVQFALGSILMAAAFLAFGLAVTVVGRLNDELGMAGWLSVVGVMAIMALIIGGACIAAKFIDPAALVMLAVGSILMAVGFIAFGLAIKFIASISLKELLKGTLVIVGITAFFLAIGVAGMYIMPFMAMSVAFFALMAASSLMLLLAMVPFGLAVKTINSMELGLETVAAIGVIALIEMALIPVGLAAIPAMIGMAPFLLFSAMASPALSEFGKALTILNNLNLSNSDKITKTIEGVSDVIDTMRDNLGVSPATLLKIASFSASSTAIVGAVRNIEYLLKKIQNLCKLKINEKQFDKLFGIVQKTIDLIANNASKFKGKAGKAAKMMGEALKDVTAAIDNIASVILKLCDLSEEKIDAGNAHIKKVIVDIFEASGDPSNPHLIDLLLMLPGVSKYTVNASEALFNISKTLDTLADTILKLGSVTPDVIQNGINAVQQEANLMEVLGDVLEKIAGQSTSGHLWWKKNTFEEAEKALNQIKPCMELIMEMCPKGSAEQFASFGNAISALNNATNIDFDPDDFEHLSWVFWKIQDDGFFTNMRNFNNECSKINVSGLNQLDAFIGHFNGIDGAIKNMYSMSSAVKQLNIALEDTGEILEEADRSNWWEKIMSTTAGKKAKTETTTSSGSTPNNTSAAVPGDNVLDTIVKVLQDWATYGIPIRGNNTSNPRPTPISDSTGGI